jgi:hypothetical protein
MQEILPSFSTTMTWVILLFCLMVVVLLGVSAYFLPQNRRRAFLGVIAMALVWGAAGISQVLLSQKGHSLTGLLLPLDAPLLMFSLYRLCFPPLVPVQTPHQNHRRFLLLLLLTLGAFITSTGLILLDLLLL